MMMAGPALSLPSPAGSWSCSFLSQSSVQQGPALGGQWDMRMPLSCQQTCVLVTLVHGLDFCQPAVEWDGGGVSRAVVRLGTIRKSPNPLSFSTCWTQNLRLLRSWDLSSNKIQFCVNDEKKINYFIPHLWRAENKSWLYS